MKLKDIYIFVTNLDSYNIYDLLYQHNFSREKNDNHSTKS